MSLLFPDSCPLCGVRGAAPCNTCAELLPQPPDLYPPALVDKLFACIAYEDNGETLIKAIKYANRRGAIQWAADVLALPCVEEMDCVTWVPSSARGKRTRGFEPSRLLAEALARRLQLPAVGLLLRSRNDGGQTTQGRHGRLKGPRLRLRRSLPGTRILLVDDVSTTGASLTSAARVLRDAGAETVHGAVIARTP